MSYIAKILQDGTLYKKNISFTYFTDEQFNKYRGTANILGCINLKSETVSSNEDYVTIVDGEKQLQFKIKKLNKSQKIIGYIYVGENNFIRVLKPSNKMKIILPIILFLFIFSMIGTVTFVVFNKYQQKEVPQSTEQTINEVSSDKIEVPLYQEFNLDSKNTSINLINPSSNSVYFIYVIKNNENVIFTSDSIMPNKYQVWDARKTLGVGSYNLVFEVSTFDVNTKTQMNGSVQNVQLEVK